jgi:hypothetical protein
MNLGDRATPLLEQEGSCPSLYFIHTLLTLNPLERGFEMALS